MCSARNSKDTAQNPQAPWPLVEDPSLERDNRPRRAKAAAIPPTPPRPAALHFRPLCRPAGGANPADSPPLPPPTLTRTPRDPPPALPTSPPANSPPSTALPRGAVAHTRRAARARRAASPWPRRPPSFASDPPFSAQAVYIWTTGPAPLNPPRLPPRSPVRRALGPGPPPNPTREPLRVPHTKLTPTTPPRTPAAPSARGGPRA
uniref:Uncharacterized protein n=1 Tax=Knipowitschia caucasica TaxID=637954 RepID=A0AAV2JH76_KNICA